LRPLPYAGLSRRTCAPNTPPSRYRQEAD
jgi:hypothetical protein